VTVLALVRTSDDRLWERLLEWRPPSWIRVWMLAASRLADGWLWPICAILLAADGKRGGAVLLAATVAAAVANVLQVLLKAYVQRARPCALAKPQAFAAVPLAWFAADRFSFPSGHALNAFTVGSTVALAYPAAVVPVFALAASIAASRVVLGLHWASDVLAGALAGAVIGTCAYLALLP
jgi:undecaprenyl-diphosphatase